MNEKKDSTFEEDKRTTPSVEYYGCQKRVSPGVGYYYYRELFFYKFVQKKQNGPDDVPVNKRNSVQLR